MAPEYSFSERGGFRRSTEAARRSQGVKGSSQEASTPSGLIALATLTQGTQQPGHLQQVPRAIQTLTGVLDVRARVLHQLPRCGSEPPGPTLSLIA
jgi:hypothetical protein